jgi:hypothetical protein
LRFKRSSLRRPNEGNGGYGSSGTGQKSFGLRKKEGVIKVFIAGGDFSIVNETTMALVPELRDDSDLDALNEGVT